jgi:hypothetical protein
MGEEQTNNALSGFGTGTGFNSLMLETKKIRLSVL